MLFPDDGKITREEKQEALQKSHISFSPLAMPSLSGPGAIAALITVSSSINGRHGIDRVFAYTNFFASWLWNRRSLSMPMKFEIRKLMFSALCGRFPVARFTSAPYAGKECRSISARANAPPPAVFGSGHPVPYGAASVVPARVQPRLAPLSTCPVDPARGRNRDGFSGKVPGAKDAVAAGGDAVLLLG